MRYADMKCSVLVELAPKNKYASRALTDRAANWMTCAVGDAAAKLKMSPYALIEHDKDGTLWSLGHLFADNCVDNDWIGAKQTMRRIAERVKQVVKLINK